MKFGFWNVRGWNCVTDTDNYELRHSYLSYMGFDVLGIAESHLVGNQILDIPGYTWLGLNRKLIHPRAKTGSGGVGILVKNTLLVKYKVSKLDTSLEGALWLHFKARNKASTSFKMCVCYLPPERSSRAVNAQDYYDELLKQVYQYQDGELFFLCGDFNSRIGAKLDFVEGVDDVSQRAFLDLKCNAHGDCLIEFLLSTNCCVMNGRGTKDDFTCISSHGSSVVDYCIVPYELSEMFTNLEVRSARSVLQEMAEVGVLDPSRTTPDHSLLTWQLQLSSTPNSHRPQQPQPPSRIKFNLNSVDTT